MEYVDRHNSDLVVSLMSCGVIIVSKNRLQLTLSDVRVEQNLHYQVEDLSKQCNEENRQQQTEETSD
jgi:hypothetical protein